MPLRAFQCKACQNDFETLVRSTDTEAPTCPACGSADLAQQVSKICVDIKYPAIARSWRAQAAREGHMVNVDKKEAREFKKG
jgi:putative FmdB family regulatory protein